MESYMEQKTYNLIVRSVKLAWMCLANFVVCGVVDSENH
jgi:hypothetical protein